MVSVSLLQAFLFRQVFKGLFAVIVVNKKTVLKELLISQAIRYR